MRKPLRFCTAVLLIGAPAFAAHPARAQTALEQDMRYQDTATMTVGETVISLGGGFAYLTLPDTRFTFRYKSAEPGDTVSKQKNDAFDEYGGGLSGSISTPLGGAFGMPWVGAVHGYWSSIENTNRNRCVTTSSQICAAADIVDTPGLSTVSANGTLISHTSRDVDSWGAALEFTTPNARPMLLPGIMKSTRWGFAFDVRGLDQDLNINGHSGSTSLFGYKETLDTTYYGGYFTIGGEYSLFPALYGGWGLRSFIDLHAGIYGADAEYNGNFNGKGIGGSRLSLSDDNVTFIGGVKFETRKQFSPRTSLSLLSEYDWYSWVPAMRYNDGDGAANGIVNRTHIADGDAFSERTSLRLNIGLGPAALYAAPHY
jgi:hypothetical protein